MTDLLEEVQEDFQNEKTLNFIAKHGRNLVLLMCAIVIGLTLNTWWQNHKMNSIHKEGGQFITAVMKMRAGKLEDAIIDFSKLSKDGSSIYSTLSQMNIASYNLSQRNFKEAEDHYAALLKKKTNPYLENYIQLMLIKTQLSDSAQDKSKILEKLNSMNSKSNIFHSSANDLIAALDLELNKPEDALTTILKVNADENCPHSIRNRLSQLQELIS